MEHIGGGEVEECRICCEEYAHGSRKRILPCNHAFHPACVDLWLLGSRAAARQLSPAGAARALELDGHEPR
ncbi:hypothetical protein EMIHUDRAFT_194195 [Emiliania huxleyi CCMP1516]|uniref:RING-type domain-containing protein n=2 Tax=Emiliania huxleyi TaxID=2903 RepID=A0A0D3L136_EMIH1|nr:hypothetical protein EMIHUDRAFT_194195 [Emiliania huxleyi CCMP1516]EOD41721.1 hypothetical protein EMIHUDRAFT_194195 [Emiliania huxleyi CCMP1516]|eukprot:XP_005794150.1 hypothetical protein EMIHUDRAFT_194195 [Emiliania huxleyi CCMP1516]